MSFSAESRSMAWSNKAKVANRRERRPAVFGRRPGICFFPPFIVSPVVLTLRSSRHRSLLELGQRLHKLDESSIEPDAPDLERFSLLRAGINCIGKQAFVISSKSYLQPQRDGDKRSLCVSVPPSARWPINCRASCELNEERARRFALSSTGMRRRHP